MISIKTWPDDSGLRIWLSTLVSGGDSQPLSLQILLKSSHRSIVTTYATYRSTAHCGLATELDGGIQNLRPSGHQGFLAPSWFRDTAGLLSGAWKMLPPVKPRASSRAWVVLVSIQGLPLASNQRSRISSVSTELIESTAASSRA